ncbi:EutN/CcmL family microcompartment protein [Paenibacillus larvae]
MIVGEVVGSLWATRKDQKLNGLTFLVVKPLSYGKAVQRDYFVSADNAGAGISVLWSCAALAKGMRRLTAC